VGCRDKGLKGLSGALARPLGFFGRGAFDLRGLRVWFRVWFIHGTQGLVYTWDSGFGLYTLHPDPGESRFHPDEYL